MGNEVNKMDKKIIITTDSCPINFKDLPPLAVGGKVPAKDNFCMEIAFPDDETEENAEFVVDNNTDAAAGKETIPEENEIAGRYKDRKLSYYAGVVRLKYLESDQGAECETDKPYVLLYSKCRFKALTVTNMLEAIYEDKEELEAYLNTGKNKALDALYSIDDGEQIDLSSEYSLSTLSEKTDETDEAGKTDSVKESIQKEYGLLCEFEHIKNKGLPCGQTEKEIIHPYAINLAVLFELYARAYTKVNWINKENSIFSGYEMMKYVADKGENIETPGLGKKSICEGKSPTIYMDGSIVPDIVLKKKDEYVILDVKYKDPTNRQDRDDRLQILAYAYLYGAKEIGHIFPCRNNDDSVMQRNEQNEFNINSSPEVSYKMYFIPTEKQENV